MCEKKFESAVRVVFYAEDSILTSYCGWTAQCSDRNVFTVGGEIIRKIVATVIYVRKKISICSLPILSYYVIYIYFYCVAISFLDCTSSSTFFLFYSSSLVLYLHD